MKTDILFDKENHQLFYEHVPKHIGQHMIACLRHEKRTQKNSGQPPYSFDVLGAFEKTIYLGHNPLLLHYNGTGFRVATPSDWTDHYKQGVPGASYYLGQVLSASRTFRVLPEEPNQNDPNPALCFFPVSWGMRQSHNDAIVSLMTDYLQTKTLSKKDIAALKDTPNMHPNLSALLLRAATNEASASKPKTLARKM